MSASKSTNLLADPGIQRHTRRILALQKKERQTRGEMGRLAAEIGAELIAVKEALDKTADKTAWQRWLKDHVHYSAETAQNYMRVARFAEKKRKRFRFFFGTDGRPRMPASFRSPSFSAAAYPLELEPQVMRTITCSHPAFGLYYYRHEIRDPDQEEGRPGIDKTARRRAEALLPARGGSPGRWTDPEELAELLAAWRGPIPLPSELSVCGLLDMAEKRNND